MATLVTRFLIFLVLATAGGYLTLFHSKVPFRMLEERLTANGLDTDGITGKVNSDIHIDRLQIGRVDGTHCVLEDIHIRYSGLRDLFLNHELLISELTVGQVVLKLSDKVTPAESDTGSVARSESGGSGIYPVSYYRAAQGIRVARIARLSLGWR